MEITKPNDILVATLNNPEATSYDLISNGIKGENTSLKPRNEYKDTSYIQDYFKDENGKFDEVSFNKMYDLAQSKYIQLTNDEYIKRFDEMVYSPFDITRPKEAKTFNVGAIYSKEFNPFKELKGWTGVNSVDQNPLSLRELAQQNKIFDPETNTWSETSLNDLNLLNKFFGDTLVYAQYDEDGTHLDFATGKTIKHKKGDWKVNEDGNIFIEKLGNREVYGKQVVNPMDTLTADGSFFNQFDFFDSDSREKSIPGVAFKLAAQIAPFLIPGFNIYYGGVSAAVSLASVLPTFYKSFEGILMGDSKTPMTQVATLMENYMSKFTQTSVSDESQDSLFNFEQIAQLAGDVFSQIYEQRAAASLSKIIKRPENVFVEKRIAELTDEVNKEYMRTALSTMGKLDQKELAAIHSNIMNKIPELKELYESQSKMAKALNLGYMALVTTGDIYGEALEQGYDRRTAGFAALTAALGQYGIMMNNRMGDWFLDKTTGYTIETNKALMRKSVSEWFKPIQETFHRKSDVKPTLATLFNKMKKSMEDTFMNGSVLGENLFKHSIVEGVEEVTEQAVLDATKGIIDTMSYLGLTKKEGSFGGFSNVFSQKGFENYLANLLGGMIGGPMFEYNHTVIEPRINAMLGKQVIPPQTRQSIYQLIGNGETEAVINEINKQKKYLGNNLISIETLEGDVVASEDGKSEADIIAENAINMINTIKTIMHSEGLVHTNDEIVKKAFMDQLLLKHLEKAKGDNPIGIEGLVLSDYTENLDKLVKIKGQINELSATEGSKESNAESIKLLEEEANIYRDKLKGILEGEFAQKYFDEAVYYLSKMISGETTPIDRETYTKTKYQKSYYELPETGVGITKERVNKEWEEYSNSTDLRKDLETATARYLEVEKLANPYIAAYTESGYKEERIKSLQNLISIEGASMVFNTSEDHAKSAITSFLETARRIEQKTGKRIIPWDVIKTNFFSHLIENGYLLSSEGKTLTDGYLDTEIDLGDSKKTRRVLIEDLVNSTLQFMPADKIDVETFSVLMQMRINDVNEHINKEIEELNKQIEALEATKTSENEAEVNGKITELQDKINELESKLWNVRIAKNYSETEEQSDKIFQLENNFKENLKILQLEKHEEHLKAGNQYNGEELLNEANAILKEKIIDPLTGKKKAKPRAQVLSELMALLGEKSGFDLGRFEDIINKKGKVNDKIAEIISTIEKDNESFKELGELSEIYEKNLKTLKSETVPFEQMNHLWKAVLEEIKSGNLDSELLELLKGTYKDSLNSIKILDASQIFSEVELVELIMKFNDSDIFVFGELDSLVLDLFDEDGITTVNDIINESQNIKTDVVKRKFQEVISNYTDSLTLLEEDEISIQEDILKNKVNSIRELLVNLGNIIKQNKESIQIIKESQEFVEDPSRFITNSIYDFIKNFDLPLHDNEKLRQTKLFDILKQEEYALSKASDLTNYLSDGIRPGDMDQAVAVLELIKSVIYGMSTTELSYEDPIGFIASRQRFAKNNGTKSDVLTLKTISSDVAEMMIRDLDRISNKIKFLKNLMLSNSGQLFLEQEITRNKTNELLLKAWKDLVDKSIKIAGNPAIDDISSILNDANLSQEQKLMQIETKFYNLNKNKSLEDKKGFLKELNEIYSSDSDITRVYNLSGNDQITKNIEVLNNLDFKLYIASNLIVNSKDFNIRLLNILKDPSFDKSPFFTQEFATKVAYASIIQPDLIKEVITKNEYNVNTDLITYVIGDGGTGKTAVVFKILVLLLQNNNPNLDIILSAPKDSQVQTLIDSVYSNIDSSKFNKRHFNKIQLFEHLGLKELFEKINDPANKIITEDASGNYKLDESIFESITIPENLPNLLFIDEITYFGAHELYLLNKLSEKAKLAGKHFKIIAAGDITQKGYEFNNVNFNVNYVSGIFPARLSITVRALNNQKRENNDAINALSKLVSREWEKSDDDKKVLEKLGGRLTLKVFHDSKTLNGDLITNGNDIPLSVYETLKNIISKNSSVKIVFLSETPELRDEITSKLTKFGITESNYKVYTPENIQGAEGDYFIFSLSSIQSTTRFASKVRALNTYLTRAKYGTVIINDAPQNVPFELVQEVSDYTQFIKPLSEDTVLENKNKRIKDLEDLLGTDLKINDDFFKFNTPEQITDPEVIINTTTLTTEEPEPLMASAPEQAVETLMVQGKTPDNNRYITHTFYNDINAKIVKNADGTYSTQGPTKHNFYGLQVSDVSQEELTEAIDNLISLKYEILKNKKHTEDFEYNGRTVSRKAIGEFVIKVTVFDSDYNAPYAKLYGNPSEQLKTGDTYANLFYRVEDVNGDLVYIHLGTFPKLSTLEKHIEGGKNSTMYKNYSEFLAKVDNELVVDPKQFNIYTSTRLKSKANKLASGKWDLSETKQFTMRDLMNVPGLKFYNFKTRKFSKTPSYQLFPGTYEEFKNYYNSFRFKEAVTEDVMQALFEKYKNKVHVAISFVETGMATDSQVKLVLVRSKHRTIKETKEIINGKLSNGVSIRQLILNKDPNGMALRKILFNGNQVLDLLLLLAKEKPGLFKALIVDTQERLSQASLDPANKNSQVLKSFIDEYNSYTTNTATKISGLNIIDRISFKNPALEKVYKLILNKVLDAEKRGQTLDVVNLKKEILEIIKFEKDTNWFYNFWNLFVLQDQVETLMDHPNALPQIKEFAEKTNEVLLNIFDFWEKQLEMSNSGIFHNVPIKGKVGTGQAIIDPDTESLNLDNVYINMAPEGPYLITEVDFSTGAPKATPVNTPSVPVSVPKTTKKTKTKIISNVDSILFDNKNDDTFNEIANALANFNDIVNPIETNLSLSSTLIKISELVDEQKNKDLYDMLENLIELVQLEGTNLKEGKEAPITEMVKTLGLDNIFVQLFQVITDPLLFDLNFANEKLAELVTNNASLSKVQQMEYLDNIDNITTNCK